MSIGSDTIRGSIKLDGFVSGKQFRSMDEFIQYLPELLTVEMPTEVTNVKVGNQQPTDYERENLWIRTDNAGSFVGLFVYSSGAWRQVYPVPGQIYLVRGDSRQPPQGYQVVTDDPGFTTQEIVNLKKLWTLGGSSPEWYTVFHCTYVGF